MEIFYLNKKYIKLLYSTCLAFYDIIFIDFGLSITAHVIVRVDVAISHFAFAPAAFTYVGKGVERQ